MRQLAGAFVLLYAMVMIAHGDATRPDLLMRPVYWQVLPADVRSVRIDPTGRPWFELDGSESIEAIKSQIEIDVAFPAPWVKSARILLFDSTGRVWLTVGNDLLLGFDPSTRKWIERKAIIEPPGSNFDAAFHAICGPAIEDSAGCVYVGDRAGCHVFDHGRWTYQPFYDLNKTRGLYFGESRQFYIPNFVKDERGRIFAWTVWGPEGCTGTLGFWIHEGATWHQTQTEIGERPGRVSAIVPLRDGKILLCPEMGRVAVARVDFDDKTNMAQLRADIALLGSQDFRTRRDAEHRILQLGPHVLPDLHTALGISKSPEQRNRIERTIAVLEEPPQQPKINDFVLANARLAGKDAKGNAILWADTVGPDGRGGRTAAWIVTDDAKVIPAPEPVTEWAPHSMLTDHAGRLFLARYQKGLGVLRRDGNITHLSDETDIPFDEILGQDRDGRVYVRNRWHVAAVNLDVADTRRTLTVTITELSASRAAACLDSRGHTVAKLAGADHPFLSLFRNGKFTDVPVPQGSAWIADLAYLQPMRDGSLVAQEQPGGDVFYFDGQTWTVHRSFRALIEKRFPDLVRQIDNSHTGVDTYASLRLDSNKNVWCVQWDHVDVYDSKQWQTYAVTGDRASLPRPILYCLPAGHEGKVVLSDGSQTLFAQLTPDGVKTTPVPGARVASNSATPAGLRVDSSARVWLPRTDDSSTLIENASVKSIENTGIPRLEDSAGRIWFINLAKHHLVALSPDGTTSQAPEDALSEDSTIVEDKTGSYWINTRSGIRHLTMDAKGKLNPEGDYYEKGLPKGACNAMWIDGQRTLWFSGSGRLYRIELP
jgi:streptogramin lyase